jgi:transcriptional regulator with XRE-family HTH domain
MSYFGDQLKNLRQAKDLSQRSFAQLLDTTQENLSRWETGTYEPNLNAIRKIAIILEVSLDYLVGLEQEDGTKCYNLQPITYKPPKTEIQSLFDTLDRQQQMKLLGYAEALVQVTQTKKA